MIFIRIRRVLTIVARCCWWRWGVSLVAAAYFEDNLHVVTGASSTDAFVEVVLGRGADEIVIVAWQELQAFGLRCERPEGDREVHGLIRVVADRYHPWIWICYPTRFILLFRHLWNTRRSNISCWDESIGDATCLSRMQFFLSNVFSVVSSSLHKQQFLTMATNRWMITARVVCHSS